MIDWKVCNIHSTGGMDGCWWALRRLIYILFWGFDEIALCLHWWTSNNTATTTTSTRTPHQQLSPQSNFLGNFLWDDIMTKENNNSMSCPPSPHSASSLPSYLSPLKWIHNISNGNSLAPASNYYFPNNTTWEKLHLILIYDVTQTNTS